MSSEHERPVTRDALRIEPDMIAKRSASSTIIQGLAATGAATYGLGKLAEGVAKLNDSFGGGEQSSTPTDPPKADK
jgi:hypothetical protein